MLPLTCTLIRWLLLFVYGRTIVSPEGREIPWSHQSPVFHAVGWMNSMDAGSGTHLPRWFCVLLLLRVASPAMFNWNAVSVASSSALVTTMVCVLWLVVPMLRKLRLGSRTSVGSEYRRSIGSSVGFTFVFIATLSIILSATVAMIVLWVEFAKVTLRPDAQLLSALIGLIGLSLSSLIVGACYFRLWASLPAIVLLMRRGSSSPSRIRQWAIGKIWPGLYTAVVPMISAALVFVHLARELKTSDQIQVWCLSFIAALILYEELLPQLSRTRRRKHQSEQGVLEMTSEEVPPLMRTLSRNWHLPRRFGPNDDPVPYQIQDLSALTEEERKKFWKDHRRDQWSRARYNRTLREAKRKRDEAKRQRRQAIDDWIDQPPPPANPLSRE